MRLKVENLITLQRTASNCEQVLEQLKQARLLDSVAAQVEKVIRENHLEQAAQLYPEIAQLKS